MSCNGCRVLRRGCSEACILRPCLQWIDSPESQGHATVFVAKFFGRAGLMSFISNVSEDQRPALFQSLLFEAAGRTVNPVNGAVGLLGSGNWQLCQAAVETVLRGGALRPLAEFVTKIDDVADCTDMFKIKKESCTATIGHGPSSSRSMVVQKRRRVYESPLLQGKVNQLADLDLSLTPGFQNCGSNNSKGKMVILSSGVATTEEEKRRLGSPSMNSEESGTTTCLESGGFEELKLLNLFY